MWRLKEKLLIHITALSLLLLLLLESTVLVRDVSAFVPCATKSIPVVKAIYSRRNIFPLRISAGDDMATHDDPISVVGVNLHRTSSRRHLFRDLMTTIISSGMALSSADISNALVKGNAPPTTSSKVVGGDKLKCTNVEECQEMAERREQQLREQQDKEAKESSTTIVTTKRGTRYRDIGTSDESKGGSPASTRTVQEGDTVTMYYKVLKLGKRSYDGLSGEGTVVFSCGYGLEDDETSPRTKSFTTTIGNYVNIVALNDGIVGMKPNTIRRIQVLPDRGWRKPDTYCDGGPGGSGTGGNLKTDYVVVPTATMVATEACFDNTKLPFPTQSYAEQRRMAQRFDQSLILEVEVIDIVKP